MEIKVYAKNIDNLTKHQFSECIKHPFFMQGALMADGHAGMDMPIGGVIKLKRYIVPTWIGSDIGCGVSSVKTNLILDDIKGKEQDIHEALHNLIPMGKGKWNNKPVKNELLPEGINDTPICSLMKENARLQLGTLGGGNHFLEIGVNSKEELSLAIHSGSRNLGYNVCSFYKSLDDGDGFLIDSKIGKYYIKDMNYCLSFALANRVQMTKLASLAFRKVLKREIEFDMQNLVNTNHNHAEIYKDGDVIHRKGATHAKKGMKGVIPGNMRDGFFIVEGLGKPESLYSCSHGAGRVMSRTKAKEKLDFANLKSQMSNITSDVCEEIIDESPDAYKNIYEVIKIQEDEGLIKVIDYFKPIINCKGL